MQQLIDHDLQLMLCKDIRGQTPLHIACQHAQTEIVRVYIQSLKLLIEAADTDLLEITDANGNSPLHLACAGQNKAVVQLLLDHGANITAANNKGENPVHTAAQCESVEIMELLLDKGDNTVIELKDHCGCTPLHYAAENNQSEIITFLQER